MGETGISGFIEQVTAPIEANLTLTNLGTVIAAGLGISLVFLLGWFAFRWIYGKIKGAFLKGR